MKILVVCQYYYPEPFRISDICEEWVKQGHEVMVITGTPNYPEGKIYKGYRYGRKRNESINGVRVHRCFTVGRHSGNVWRALNYYSFAFSSTIYASYMNADFDIVFVNQLSPVMMAYAGIRYAKKHGRKLILYSLDLWPASLAPGGIGMDSRIFKLFHRIARKIYEKADKILVSSKSFEDYFRSEFDICSEKIEYLPQYAEDLYRKNPESPCCDEAEDKDSFNLVFTGNIGTLQSVDTIIRAANVLRVDKTLRWHIIGDGSKLEECKELAKEYWLTNVFFHGRKPVEQMPKYYAMADAMIVTLIDDMFLSLTLPGKVQSYMAAGKPIIGAINGEAQAVIEKANCGFCCNAGDYEGLARSVMEFVGCGQKQSLGENARKYYEEHFSKDSFFGTVNQILDAEACKDKQVLHCQQD